MERVSTDKQETSEIRSGPARGEAGGAGGLVDGVSQKDGPGVDMAIGMADHAAGTTKFGVSTEEAEVGAKKQFTDPPAGSSTEVSTMARSDSAPPSLGGDVDTGDSLSSISLENRFETTGNIQIPVAAPIPSQSKAPLPLAPRPTRVADDLVPGNAERQHTEHAPPSTSEGTHVIPTVIRDETMTISRPPLQQATNAAESEQPASAVNVVSNSPPSQVLGIPQSNISTSDAVDHSVETLLNSPKAQHDEIVERSPGGRYVRFREKLGSGAYKDVYRAYDTSEGIEVAWNVVNLSGVPKSERSRIVNEVRLLERLHHSNIISFHGSWVNRELEQVIFVTEILSSGTLTSFINKVQVIRWKIAKRWAIQILKGLQYLHGHDPPIIHRDLKCDNIFINGASGDLRIGDLGLSTVISNKGKVLSVLGTPEFMAPELYDEAYDEKVDIYAFGMCMLEIFTKELPYRECSNPAQIYKKVTQGILPESLRRVRNAEAREFIMLCLGVGQGGSPSTRPSASQLLGHPFLAKREDDGSEVEVGPPERQNGITDIKLSVVRESGGESSRSGSPSLAKDHSRADNLRSINTTQPMPNTDSKMNGVRGSAEASAQHHATQVQSHDLWQVQARASAGKEIAIADSAAESHGTVRNSEANMPSQKLVNISGDIDQPRVEQNTKNVRPLMDSGEEITGQVDSPPLPPAPASTTAPMSPNALDRVGADSLPLQSTGQPPEEKANADGGSGVSGPVRISESQYVGFAAVVEEETEENNPYDDDIMKLIIRLPVEGKVQSVQFDFHLVEDDPVQVAREMVTELNIPEDALLEISGTISGLARSARIKQGRRSKQQVQRVASHQSQQSGTDTVGSYVISTTPNIASGPTTDVITGSPEGKRPAVPPLTTHENASLGSVTKHHQPQQQANTMNNPDKTFAGSIVPPGNQGHVSGLASNVAGTSFAVKPQMSHQPPGQYDNEQSNASHKTPRREDKSKPHAPAKTKSEPNGPKSILSGTHEMNEQIPRPLTEGAGSIHPKSSGIQPSHTQHRSMLPMQQNTSVSTSKSLAAPGEASGAASKMIPIDNASHVATTKASSTRETLGGEFISNVGIATDLGQDEDGTNSVSSDDTDETNVEEIRKLEETYRKNMTRAMKAFDTRMDNLQRSKEQKEAQHLQTLQKYEKERAEFEKKVRMAEAERTKRLADIEQDFARQRELLQKDSGSRRLKRKDAAVVKSATRIVNQGSAPHLVAKESTVYHSSGGVESRSSSNPSIGAGRQAPPTMDERQKSNAA